MTRESKEKSGVFFIYYLSEEQGMFKTIAFFSVPFF
jgi:hypothetical protein